MIIKKLKLFSMYGWNRTSVVGFGDRCISPLLHTRLKKAAGNLGDDPRLNNQL